MTQRQINPLRPTGNVPQGFGSVWAGDVVMFFEEWFQRLQSDIEMPGMLKTKGRAYGVTPVTTPEVNITRNDDFIPVNYSGAVTLYLPDGSLLIPGRRFIVQDESGNAGSNNITIQRQGTDLINGASTTTISTNYGRSEIVWTGSQYLV